jgi:hypothetical protein
MFGEDSIWQKAATSEGTTEVWVHVSVHLHVVIQKGFVPFGINIPTTA